MKILYFANARIPTEKAHGFQIMKMCQSFASVGVDVELVLPTRVNSDFKNTDTFEHYRLEKNFKISKIKAFDPEFLINFPAGFYIKFQALFFIFSLVIYLLFKKDKDQFIFYTRDEYLLPILQKFSKKVVWEGHALPKNLNKYLKYLKRNYKNIVLNQQLRFRLVKQGISDDLVLVSHDAVDLKIFDIELTRQDARKELNLPQEKLILGYTGSFKTKGMDKGISDILLSLKQISKPVLFVAIGGIEADIKFYLDLARKNGVENQVKFTGPVPQTQLAKYQKACDILLMPFPENEHYSYFMSPLKMFEYMASKRPIIATGLPTILEVLNQENSLLVIPDDPKALAEGINKLIDNNALGEKISAQAYLDVKNYTWEKRVSEIIKFIWSE